MPIGPFPGPVFTLLNSDVALGILGEAGTVARLFLARQGQQAGDVVGGSIRTAPGGAGAGLAFAFPAGGEIAQAEGPLDVAASDTIYLRITAADLHSQDLRGWLELEGPAGLV